MRFEDLALELIERVYAAAEDPRQWDGFLARLAEGTGATVTGFIFEDFGSHRASVHATTGIDPEMVRQYEEYYARKNAWFAAAGFRLPTGVVQSEELLPNEDLRKTEYYNDFLRKIDSHHGLAATLLHDEKFLSHLSLLRPRRAGPFDREVRPLLLLLLPHLKRALQLHRQIAGLRSDREAAIEVLDRVPAGVILFDRDGRPVLVNRTGREILDSNDGLILQPGGLAAAAAAESAVLDRLLRDAIEIAAGRSMLSDSGGTLAVSRPSSRRPFLVFVTPLRPGRAKAPDPRPAAALFITDPERKVHANGTLRRLYRFTPTEAEIADKLIQGESLEQAADELEITLNTARTHLKHLFTKTETNRHRELVRVLLLACANLPPAA
jgi:DNA-binding CsgD family transcriptional regulator/PAS domain-containing protein